MAAKLRFYQRGHRAQRDEIAIGSDLTLAFYKFNYGHGDVRNDLIAVKIEFYTDSVAIFRRLDQLGVPLSIERSKLRTSDDVARLLVRRGLKHVPRPGLWGGDLAAEIKRIEAVHAPKVTVKHLTTNTTERD